MEAVKKPAGRDQGFRWLLDVQETGTGGHPLGITVGDRSAAALGVLMLEGAVDHVGHRLETTMGMPGGAFGLSRRILDFTHLVEMDERIELVEGDAGERSPDRKSLAFKSALGGRDGPAPGARSRPSWGPQPEVTGHRKQLQRASIPFVDSEDNNSCRSNIPL